MAYISACSENRSPIVEAGLNEKGATQPGGPFSISKLTLRKPVSASGAT